MNPSNSETGMQLPPPVVEQAPVTGGQSAESAPRAPEQAPTVLERTPSGANRPAAGAAVPPLVLPVATQPSVPPAPASTQATSGTPAVADDNDLIEKEWVNKAKQIVERTRDDPYKQTEELTLVKVDYMKKRYGKTLKLNK